VVRACGPRRKFSTAWVVAESTWTPNEEPSARERCGVAFVRRPALGRECDRLGDRRRGRRSCPLAVRVALRDAKVTRRSSPRAHGIHRLGARAGPAGASANPEHVRRDVGMRRCHGQNRFLESRLILRHFVAVRNRDALLVTCDARRDSVARLDRSLIGPARGNEARTRRSRLTARRLAEQFAGSPTCRACESG